MSNNDKLQNLERFMKECASLEFEKNAPLYEHSTFKIGGNADYIAFPKSESAFCALVDYLNDEKIKYCVVGNGSNLLFSDDGYRGVVIVTTKLNKIRKTRNTIYAECGVLLTSLSLYACKNGLSGLEFAYGIPGTVGGALYMNAGAYGGEISDVLQKSAYFDKNLSKRCELYKAGHKFGYRTSVYQENNNVILSCFFELKPGNPDEIRKKMDEYMSARKAKQPLEYASAGSTFKRCEGRFTAQMIDEAGLKGASVGEAMISTKHAGFIVNTGSATSKDVKELIGIVKAKLKEKFDVDIQEEVRFID